MGKKNKSKNSQSQEKTDPDDYKQQGNEALNQGNVAKAIQFYSQAIELNDNNEAYFNNRSLAYFSQGEYSLALQDANKALEIKQDYAKALIRKSEALKELGQIKDSFECYEKAIQIDKELLNEEFYKKLKELILEYEKEDQFNQENPQYKKLIDWLIKGGSSFPKLKICHYSENYRGVHCRQDVKMKEIVVVINKDQIITLEMAKQTEFAKILIQKKVDLLSPKHSFLSIFLLQEKKNPDSYWKIYLDILPSHYNQFPIFFKQEDLKWLEGSPFQNQVKDKYKDILQDYTNICKICPTFQQNTIEEFCWARTTACSRIFGITLNGVKTDALVPFADMLNHRRPKQTSWYFDDKINGFVIESIDNLCKGSQIYDSYGRKCNSRFFLNYGFIVENNEANEVLMRVQFDKQDQYLKIKNSMIKENTEGKNFRISINFDENNNQEFMGYVRFVVLQDQNTLTKLQESFNQFLQEDPKNKEHGVNFKPQKTPPINISNEISMWNHILSHCQKALSFYETTYDQDLQILKNQQLTLNQQNCVYLRSGEKKILLYYIEMANKMIFLLNLDKIDLTKAIQQNQFYMYHSYISKVICGVLHKN